MGNHHIGLLDKPLLHSDASQGQRGHRQPPGLTERPLIGSLRKWKLWSATSTRCSPNTAYERGTTSGADAAIAPPHIWRGVSVIRDQGNGNCWTMD